MLWRFSTLELTPDPVSVRTSTGYHINEQDQCHVCPQKIWNLEKNGFLYGKSRRAWDFRCGEFGRFSLSPLIVSQKGSYENTAQWGPRESNPRPLDHRAEIQIRDHAVPPRRSQLKTKTQVKEVNLDFKISTICLSSTCSVWIEEILL